MCLGGGSAPATPPPAPPPSAPVIVQTGASMSEAKRRLGGQKGSTLRAGDRGYNPYKRKERKVYDDGTTISTKRAEPPPSPVATS